MGVQVNWTSNPPSCSPCRTSDTTRIVIGKAPFRLAASLLLDSKKCTAAATSSFPDGTALLTDETSNVELRECAWAEHFNMSYLFPARITYFCDYMNLCQSSPHSYTRLDMTTLGCRLQLHPLFSQKAITLSYPTAVIFMFTNKSCLLVLSNEDLYILSEQAIEFLYQLPSIIFVINIKFNTGDAAQSCRKNGWRWT